MSRGLSWKPYVDPAFQDPLSKPIANKNQTSTSASSSAALLTRHSSAISINNVRLKVDQENVKSAQSGSKITAIDKFEAEHSVISSSKPSKSLIHVSKVSSSAATTKALHKSVASSSSKLPKHDVSMMADEEGNVIDLTDIDAIVLEETAHSSSSSSIPVANGKSTLSEMSASEVGTRRRRSTTLSSTLPSSSSSSFSAANTADSSVSSSLASSGGTSIKQPSQQQQQQLHQKQPTISPLPPTKRAKASNVSANIRKSDHIGSKVLLEDSAIDAFASSSASSSSSSSSSLIIGHSTRGRSGKSIIEPESSSSSSSSSFPPLSSSSSSSAAGSSSSTSRVIRRKKVQPSERNDEPSAQLASSSSAAASARSASSSASASSTLSIVPNLFSSSTNVASTNKSKINLADSDKLSAEVDTLVQSSDISSSTSSPSSSSLSSSSPLSSWFSFNASIIDCIKQHEIQSLHTLRKYFAKHVAGLCSIFDLFAENHALVCTCPSASLSSSAFPPSSLSSSSSSPCECSLCIFELLSHRFRFDDQFVPSTLIRDSNSGKNELTHSFVTAADYFHKCRGNFDSIASCWRERLPKSLRPISASPSDPHISTVYLDNEHFLVTPCPLSDSSASIILDYMAQHFHPPLSVPFESILWMHSPPEHRYCINTEDKSEGDVKWSLNSKFGISSSSSLSSSSALGLTSQLMMLLRLERHTRQVMGLLKPIQKPLPHPILSNSDPRAEDEYHNLSQGEQIISCLKPMNKAIVLQYYDPNKGSNARETLYDACDDVLWYQVNSYSIRDSLLTAFQLTTWSNLLPYQQSLPVLDGNIVFNYPLVESSKSLYHPHFRVRRIDEVIEDDESGDIGNHQRSKADHMVSSDDENDEDERASDNGDDGSSSTEDEGNSSEEDKHVSSSSSSTSLSKLPAPQKKSLHLHHANCLDHDQAVALYCQAYQLKHVILDRENEPDWEATFEYYNRQVGEIVKKVDSLQASGIEYVLNEEERETALAYKKLILNGTESGYFIREGDSKRVRWLPEQSLDGKKPSQVEHLQSHKFTSKSSFFSSSSSPTSSSSSSNVNHNLAVVYADYQYKASLYEYLLCAQDAFQVDPAHIQRQPDINPRMRSILVDWMIEVHMKFKLKPETLHLTINIIDRCLHKERVDRVKLQLLGCGALLIASKYEEIFSPEIHDFVYITDHAYNADEIKEMESHILNVIEFDLTVPTSVMIASMWMHWDCLEFEFPLMSHFVHFFLDLMLVDLTYQVYSPLQQALAAVMLSRAIYSELPLIPQALVSKSPVLVPTDIFQARQCVLVLHALWINQDPREKSVRKKYANQRHGCVSRHPMIYEFGSPILSTDSCDKLSETWRQNANFTIRDDVIDNALLIKPANEDETLCMPLSISSRVDIPKEAVMKPWASTAQSRQCTPTRMEFYTQINFRHILDFHLERCSAHQIDADLLEISVPQIVKP